MTRMWKSLVTGLAAVLLMVGVLWATDNTWNFPVPTLGGLVQGDLIYARGSNNLGNISAVAAGQTLVSAGTSTQPTWSATPRLGRQLRTLQTTAPTCADTGKCSAITGSDSAGIITIGATPVNAFVVTFNAAWSVAPACTVTQQTTAANYVTKVLTATDTMTVSSAATPTASDKYSYVCLGVS